MADGVVVKVVAQKVTDNLFDLVAYDQDGKEVAGKASMLFIPIRRGDNATAVVETYCRSYAGYAEYRNLFLDAAKQVKFT